MLSSLLRPRKGRRRIDKSPFSSPFSPQETRNKVARDDTQSEDGAGHEEHGEEAHDGNGRLEYNQDEDDEDDEDDDLEPLLPIFSAEHLDKLPLYNITHSIRILIVQKCETTLSWDQLRSPQVSQFLVKPIQSNVRANHFNRATLCALIANSLQFKKEAEMQPGNAGVSKTRAMISELLAMRLLKEFTTRELIDALSYDFDPLQGFMAPGPVTGATHARIQQARGARISTVEIAIRAQAKRFLAHSLVVQQLEAIWAGSIVFHSAADNLHRRPPKAASSRDRGAGYGTIEALSPGTRPADAAISKRDAAPKQADYHHTRRTVTLYDPRDASMFKLSRLRVPRYRQLFSTVSFAVMLCLFLAVLLDRSLTITPLEVVFWFWSAGYMLDEVVGFTEQGFGLYIMSVWNAFDLGILLLFIGYYVLRLYGILMPEARKHYTAHMAYDVLASTAVLLFPRAFSVLDHYRYFSQLLIAFRMMAQDLVAILVLIIISCSGFFVAFTVSFSDDAERTNGGNVAYALFQILMGFTPAAWERWSEFNILGKIIMTMFLIICHFLIVTILITVLTNSFMAIVQNADAEHQFLFAVNAISMVKSDALFSYIPPTNIVGWLASPMRYIIPFRQFVKLNRTIIKVTHFPVLLSIFAYERLILSKIAYEPTDLVERRGRRSAKIQAFSMGKAPDLFSPSRRMREPSVVSFHKDRALDEVFRRPFRGSTMRTTGADMMAERKQSTNVVDNWMQEVGEEGGASPPLEQPRSVLERLENRRPNFRRSATGDRSYKVKRDFSTATRSVMSDPEDPTSAVFLRRPQRIEEDDEMDPIASMESLPQETDADGDDELVSHEDGDAVTIGRSSAVEEHPKPDAESGKENVPACDEDDNAEDDFFATPTAAKPLNFPASVPLTTRARLLDATNLQGTSSGTAPPKRGQHDRHASTSTVLFSAAQSSSASDAHKAPRPATARYGNSSNPIPSAPASASGRKPAKPATPSRARPIMPQRGAFGQTAPNIHSLSGVEAAMPTRNTHSSTRLNTLGFESAFPQRNAHSNSQGLDIPHSLGGGRRNHRKQSFNARALDLASDLGDNRYGPDASDEYPLARDISGMPASFSEQLLRERDLARERRRDDERSAREEEEKGRVGRIMLARMNTLEEGFREMLTAVKDLKSQSRGGSDAGGSGNGKRSSLNLTMTMPTPVGSVGAGPGESRPRFAGPRISGEKGRKPPRKLQRRGTKAKDGGTEEGLSPLSRDSSGAVLQSHDHGQNEQAESSKAGAANEDD